VGEFAKPSDVAGRLGRDLTTKEEGIATAVIATVTGLITDAVDRDAEWATDLDPVPEGLKALCVEKAIGAISNPSNLASESETVGSYQHGQSFPRSGDVSVFLTPFEERLAARAVYGSNAGSSAPDSIIDRVVQLREGEEPA
jgi:hypothetical protein